MDEEEEKPIRVVDRRMFTPAGELREGFEPEEEFAADSAPPPLSPTTPAPGPPLESAPRPEAEEGAPREPAGDFASIVRSLATTAYASLGLLTDPATEGRPRDPAVARQMIDWLDVLEQKTRGNLTFEESDFLSRVLYELRLAYVEVTRPPAK